MPVLDIQTKEFNSEKTGRVRDWVRFFASATKPKYFIEAHASSRESFAYENTAERLKHCSL